MSVEAIEAHSGFSNQFHAVLFTLTTAMVKCGVGGEDPGVSGKHYTLVHFFIL